MIEASCFSNDVVDFIRWLAHHHVKYVIVGGEAVIYYGHIRLTGDIDFFYEPTPENVGNLFNALNDFWKGSIPGIEKPEELQQPGTIIQFGVSPHRIDLMSSISSVTFTETWESRVTEKIIIKGKETIVYFIGLKQLIKNKEGVKRNRDCDDLKFLKKIKKKNP